MPSNWTDSDLELQAAGEGTNVWGEPRLNSTITRINYLSCGFLSITLTGDYVMTTQRPTVSMTPANFTGRIAFLRFTGSPSADCTITVPSVAMRWTVWNNTAKILTFTTGAGATVTVAAGEKLLIVTDGASGVYRVQSTSLEGARLRDLADPSADQDAATKKYVDDTAFAGMSGTFPGQGGNAGKFLKTDGSTPSWAYPLPAQATANGKFLKSIGADGTEAWDAVDAGDITSFSASAAAIRVGTTTTSAMTPGDAYNALAEVTLTNNSTTIVTSGSTLDMSLFTHAAITLGGNWTLPNPTSPKPGQRGRIRIIQDGSGNRGLALGGNWKRSGGAPAPSTAAGAIDILQYDVITSSYILYTYLKSPS